MMMRVSIILFLCANTLCLYRTLVNAAVFNGDIFVNYDLDLLSGVPSFRLVVSRDNDDDDENTLAKSSSISMEYILNNITHINGKLSFSGRGGRGFVFKKLSFVGEVEIENFESDGETFDSLLYINGNVTIRDSVLNTNRFAFARNVRTIRGSVVYEHTDEENTSSAIILRNVFMNVESIGGNVEIRSSSNTSGLERIESTAFPSLVTVGGSFLINSTTLQTIENGAFRQLNRIGRDFIIRSDVLKSISNFQALQVVEGLLDLQFAVSLESLDGMQNLRRVGSGDIKLPNDLLKGEFGFCGNIRPLEEDTNNNITKVVITHRCFYDNYKFCQNVIRNVPNAYRCVNTIATVITTNQNLRKFSRLLEVSGEVLYLQALQKPLTIFAPVDSAFLYLRGDNNNNNDTNSQTFSEDLAVLKSVVRAHSFSTELRDVYDGERLISKLGEEETLQILLSRDGSKLSFNNANLKVAHAVEVQRQQQAFLTTAQQQLLTSPIDSVVCDTFFRSRTGASESSVLSAKFCSQRSIARISLRSIDILPYDENDAYTNATTTTNTNINDSGGSNIYVNLYSTSCLDRCGSFSIDSSASCSCDEACKQNGDCCGDYSYFCSIQYFLSRAAPATSSNRLLSSTSSTSFKTSRDFSSSAGESERTALVIKPNALEAYNGVCHFVDRVLHPLSRYQSKNLLMYTAAKKATGGGNGETDLSSKPPPPPPPRPPPAPRRVTSVEMLFSTRPPPPSASAALRSPPPPPTSSSTKPPPALTSTPPQSSSSQQPPSFFQPPPPPPIITTPSTGSCKVQSPNICGLCDYSDESSICCCDSMCVTTGDCCQDYSSACI